MISFFAAVDHYLFVSKKIKKKNIPCNISVTCFVAQHSETPTKSNFITNSVGVVDSRSQRINIYVHITAFYPKDGTKTCDLDRFSKGDVIHVQGRFTIIDSETDNGDKVKILKVSE